MRLYTKNVTKDITKKLATEHNVYETSTDVISHDKSHKTKGNRGTINVQEEPMAVVRTYGQLDRHTTITTEKITAKQFKTKKRLTQASVASYGFMFVICLTMWHQIWSLSKTIWMASPGHAPPMTK